ncbi:MAG: HEPN domain-containing protein [Armatimonadia bacterium]|nr:HEPN domain-containing protein [Armatimonadia bacterium]
MPNCHSRRTPLTPASSPRPSVRGRCCTPVEGEAATEGWLHYAREDLTTARRLLEWEDAPPRHTCFLCQQAAENAIEHLLIHQGTRPPRTHDLDALARLVTGDAGPLLRTNALSLLTQWAVESRYPSLLPEPDRSDACQAEAEASRVLEVVENAVMG